MIFIIIFNYLKISGADFYLSAFPENTIFSLFVINLFFKYQVALPYTVIFFCTLIFHRSCLYSTYHILFLIFNFLFLSSFIFPLKSLYIRPLIADQRMSLILEQNICKLRLMELEENVLSSLANSVCDPVEDRDLVLNFEISQGKIGEMMSKKESR